MNNTIDQTSRNAVRARRLCAAAFVLAGALGAIPQAAAQNISSPPTPTDITPKGSTAFLVGHATGTQGYVCLPKGEGASWTVKGARPEATLFAKFFGQDFQIITHFLSPNTNPNEFAPKPLPFGNATWQSSLDTSKIWAQVVGSIPAGSDSSCPNTDSIACLLLQVIGAQSGPTGGKSLNRTTFVQRLNTKGGLAPAEGCSVPSDVGAQALVPYTADYYFFQKN
ncbi:MAG: DUF3455 domain-containing protein [Bryobacteraceae bacterium]